MIQKFYVKEICSMHYPQHGEVFLSGQALISLLQIASLPVCFSHMATLAESAAYVRVRLQIYAQAYCTGAPF
jgi:hypothetical protein